MNNRSNTGVNVAKTFFPFCGKSKLERLYFTRFFYQPCALSFVCEDEMSLLE
jgi:hypothetical protein